MGTASKIVEHFAQFQLKGIYNGNVNKRFHLKYRHDAV